MMNVLSIALIIQFTFQISTAAFHEYSRLAGRKSWYEANLKCLEMTPGSLASLLFDHMDDYVALKEAKNINIPKNPAITDDQPFWVGLFRNKLGRFSWIDGSPCERNKRNDTLCVHDWLEPPVAGDGKDCATLTVDGTDGTRGYRAQSCDDTFRYLCSSIEGTSQAGIRYVEDDAIEGVAAIVSGDPHFITWSGVRHDYMGNPHIDGLYSFFYYVAPCYDASPVDLPFTILGKHRTVGRSRATHLQYVTLELFKNTYSKENQYDKYYLWINSTIAAYIDTDNIPVDTDRDDPCYDHHIENTTNLDHPNEYQAIGDGRFQVKYNKTSDGIQNHIDVWLKIDDEKALHFKISGSATRRISMHRLVMDPPENYRPFICGLSGDFRRPRNGRRFDPQTLITCKGGLEPYQWGWDNDRINHPNWEFAWDLHGNTWSYYYANHECPFYEVTSRRRLIAAEDQVYIPEVGDDFVYEDPCDSSIEQQVITACQAARDAASDECDIVGDEACDELQVECELDACAMSGNDASVIDENVEIAFTLNLQDMVADVDNTVGAAHAVMGANQIERFGEYESPANEYPHNPDVVAIKSTWIFYGGLLLSILLTVNCAYMCYLNTLQKEKTRYSVVKFTDSEYDDSEAPIIEKQKV